MKDEKLQQKYLEYQILMQQLQQLKENITALEKHIINLTDFKHYLKDISEVNAGSETLMPLGSGIFLKGELKDNKNVIMNVGSGICVEKSSEDAAITVEKQLSEVSNLCNEMRAEVEDILGRINELGEELQATSQ